MRRRRGFITSRKNIRPSQPKRSSTSGVSVSVQPPGARVTVHVFCARRNGPVGMSP